jgi:hypothetical protein
MVLFGVLAEPSCYLYEEKYQQNRIATKLIKAMTSFWATVLRIIQEIPGYQVYGACRVMSRIMNL